MKEKPVIALHTDELNSSGISLEPIHEIEEGFRDAHRDDHYMFILQQKGSFICEVDFNELVLEGPAICFVTPGQVHRYLRQQGNMGSFVFADPALVAEQYREVFDAYQQGRQVVSVEADDMVFGLIPVLEQVLNGEDQPLKASLIASLTGSLIGMVASAILQSGTSGQSIGGQKYQTTIRFKQLVRQHYKEMKLVLEYADLLNITPLYLNEVVKEITGFPASHWVQQEIILEAKRLLYYTALDVKQIAYELGYEDHTYFSRFFKKNSGMTAIEFRTKSRDMSNHDH